MIIIAHCLSTIQNCDYIYVIESGEIVEEGTFNNLISNQNTILKKCVDYKTCKFIDKAFSNIFTFFVRVEN